MSNRGRARGRARSVAEQQVAAPGRGAAPAPSARPVGAWGSGNPMRGAPPSQVDLRAAGPGPAPALPPAQPVSWGPQSQQARLAAPTPAAAGRAQVQGDQQVGPARAAPVAPVRGDGNGGDSHSGRGALRGRRAVPETTLSTRLPTLTKQGQVGKKITLQTNYFRLDKRTDWCIYQYRVDFAPEIDVTHIKRKLFYTAILAMNIQGLFDGTVLYTPFRINPDPKEVVVDSLSNPEEKVRITIRMVAELNKSSYQYLQFYNLVLRKCMRHLNLQLIRRDYYDPNNKIVVAALNLELWPGIVTSIRQHESDILMCAEIKHKIMKTETALHVMRKITNDSRHHSWQDVFRDRMLDCIVLTDYNNKTYRVDDVDFTCNPMSTFQLKDGSQTTFGEYYRNRYGLSITDQKQPLLVTKVKPKELRGEGGSGGDGPKELTMLLIPEFCRMCGLTEEERTNRQMKDQLEQYMMPTPKTRLDHLRSFNARLQNTPGSMQEMQQFDLALSREPLSLTARHLSPENLFFQPTGTNNTYSAGADVDWTRSMRGKPLYRNARIGTWAIVFSNKDAEGVKGFYNDMLKAAQGMKWNLGQPLIKHLDDSRKPYDKVAFNNMIESLSGSSQDVMFYFIVVPNNRTDHYGFIKKKLTVEKGIPSQMVTAKTCYHKSRLSIATKVVVQMNCKLGGAPWSVHIPLPLMICGYDVCHDPKNKSQSFGALVASYDQKATAYYSTVAAHKDGEELSNFIAISMVKAVAHYRKENNALPAQILFYRDGVGDGQISFVYEHELKTMYAQLEHIYAPQQKKPVIRMILVNKRINTRFFFNGQNPPPGTVVDDVVTLPERSDFFLVSQCTRKGTVSPTYYSILGPDQFTLDSDKTQVLTYRLCHQYYNWGGTVRVPAPCQYAHKLAFLAAQSLQRPPKESLSHLLHFL